MGTRFLGDLEAAADGRGKHHRKMLSAEDRVRMLDTYHAAQSA